MKILLVQIKGFENESLENEIKSFFESRNCEVIGKSLDLSEVTKNPEVLLIDSISIDYMIGGRAGKLFCSFRNRFKF